MATDKTPLTNEQKRRLAEIAQPTMGKHGHIMSDQANDSRQAGTIGSYKNRGVWVPDGMAARDIMAGAAVLERDLNVPPFESREMVRRILGAIALAAKEPATADLCDQRTKRFQGYVLPPRPASEDAHPFLHATGNSMVGQQLGTQQQNYGPRLAKVWVAISHTDKLAAFPTAALANIFLAGAEAAAPGSVKIVELSIDYGAS